MELFLEDNTMLYQRVTLEFLNILNVCKNDESSLLASVYENCNIDITSTGKNVKNFFEILGELNSTEYQTHFRMRPSTMTKLIEYLKRNIPISKLNAMIIPFEKKVHIAVWLLANKDSYREAGNLFGLHKSSVSYIFHEICKIIAECRFDLIKWPSREEQLVTKEYVLKRHRFPNCVGFIDGCHIQILAPANNPTDFHNRKEVHSVILQAVCDETLKFTNIYLGQTGRAHDARVFRESYIGEELQNLVSAEDHILGDSAYSLSLRLLTPFQDNGYLSESQKIYNKVHSGARAHIERAFGLLKGKFRRLKYLELHDVNQSSIIVCAACVLHNFLILNEPINSDNNFEDEIEVNLELEGLQSNQKRDSICEFISTLE